MRIASPWLRLVLVHLATRLSISAHSPRLHSSSSRRPTTFRLRLDTLGRLRGASARHSGGTMPRKRKMSWRSLKFISTGGEESHAITRKDKGFMHLCEVYRYQPEQIAGYTVHDTKGMFTQVRLQTLMSPGRIEWRWRNIRCNSRCQRSPPAAWRDLPAGTHHRAAKATACGSDANYQHHHGVTEDVLEWLWRVKGTFDVRHDVYGTDGRRISRGQPTLAAVATRSHRKTRS